jgi:hypothetical protein
MLIKNKMEMNWKSIKIIKTKLEINFKKLRMNKKIN